MPAKLPHYLIRSRHGIYYLRIVRDGREKRKSLRTRDPAVARRAAYLFGATISAMKIPNFDKISSYAVRKTADGGMEINTDGSPEDHARAMEALAMLLGVEVPQANVHERPPQSAAIANTPKHPISIKEATERWFMIRSSRVTYSQVEAWLTHFKRLKSEFGEDTLVHMVTAPKVTDVLMKMVTPERKIKTVNEYAYTWRQFFEWLRKDGHTLINPVNIPEEMTEAQAARVINDDDKKRRPWTSGDLDKIFNPDRLNKLERPEFVWLPWIALFTGARREAIIQLRIKDIQEYKAGGWSIFFDKKYDKNGKERTIPMPPDLIQIGFLDYVTDVRKLKLSDDSLFPHVPSPPIGRSHYFGNRFSAEKKQLGCDRSADFHGFRTTLITVLAGNLCHPIYERLYVGHESDNVIARNRTSKVINDVHQINYTQIEELEKFAIDGIANAVFPCLDFSVLKWQLPDWKYQPGTGSAQIKRLIRKSQ